MSQLSEYLKSGYSKLTLSYFTAIDSIVAELSHPKYPPEAIAVLEYMMDLNIRQIERFKWTVQFNNGEESFDFNNHQFENLLIEAFTSKKLSIQQLCDVYSTIFWVRTEPVVIGRRITNTILVDTHMDHFNCTKCGHCCLNLGDAYCTSCDSGDYDRWVNEKRQDILEYIECGDLWFSPITGDEVERCPWLRKVRNKEQYNCQINNTKPKHCREFPKSKRHALLCGCQGFGEVPYDHQHYFEKYRKI